MMANLIWLVVLLPFCGFLINGLGRNFIPKTVAAAIGSATVLGAFGLVLGMFLQILGGQTEPQVIPFFTWIAAGDFSVQASFQVDQLSVMMMMIITGVGFLIHVYSAGYMHTDEGHNKFFAYLNLFIFFMLLLVAGSNYLLLFVGWEGVGLCSYLLIGFWYKNVPFADAAKKAFIVNRIGDLGFLLGMLLIWTTFGSLSYLEVFDKAAGMSVGAPVLITITLLLFVGAIGKSAQIPLFVWLPDAMAGPTPVSALIHAATMVTAGIYLIVRSNILYALAPVSLMVVGIVGLITAVLAATIGIFQNDIKKVLAYSTVSQLGYMFVALGLGAYTTAMFHLTTHAFFKALLFLGAGSVIHGMHHEQDMRKMGNLRKKMPVTFITFLLATLAISGIPPFSGFFSKDEILAHAFGQGHYVIWALALLASFCTIFYMFRALYLTFYGKFRGTAEEESHVHESPKSMTFPLIVLAVLSVFGGLMNIPEIMGGNHWLVNYLEPVFEQARRVVPEQKLHISHAVEWSLMAGTVAWLVVLIFVARWLYVKKGRVPAPDGAPMSALQKLIYRKYYVDEIYEVLVVKNVTRLSNLFFNVVESKGVDGAGSGLGNLAVRAGKTLRYIQTGNTAFYIMLMVFGIIGLLMIKFIF